VSFTEKSLDPVDEPYRRQMTSYRRTRSAILEATKILIARHGLQVTSMIEIADTAEVSRATLYNHFRSKESVMRGLLEFEVSRILELAASESSPAQALARISIEISSDPALATMRAYDPAVLTQLLSAGADPLWQQIHQALLQLFSSSQRVELILRWLIGQVFAPLNPEQSAHQAAVIVA
jgi:TetR/AcrR family transcriptional regulator, transcriptional repressor of aconitase